MDGYRSLDAWKLAQALSLGVLAAEAQRLLVIAARRGYLPPEKVRHLLEVADRTIGCLVGLLRSRNLPFE